MKRMTALFTFLSWALPAIILLGWQRTEWKRRFPNAKFSDKEQEEATFFEWCKADFTLFVLMIGVLLLVVIPLGSWLLLLFAFADFLIEVVRRSEGTLNWKKRAKPRAIALGILFLIPMMAAFVPASQPFGEAVWGEPFSSEATDAPPWPASEQYIWILSDGTIIVETHLNTPGILMPIGAVSAVNTVAQLTGAKEARFEQAASLMDDWTGQNSFSLSPIHDGVKRDYSGETLMYTHDDIMLDLFGMHPSGELITVYKPVWGGEIHLLTIIKMGPDPFVGNPGAQSYVQDWLTVA